MSFLRRLFKRKVTKKRLDSKLKRFISRFGETSDAKTVEKFLKENEMKDEFLSYLVKIKFAKGSEKERLIKEAKKIADKIPSFKGWPEKPVKFWDIESLSWRTKIPVHVRLFIRKELLKRIKLGGLNLSLGAGSYPYIEDSVLVDISSEMLKAVEPAVKFKRKLVYDLEKGNLPFKDSVFDTVTMVFVINYLKNLETVFKEIYSVLKKKGKVIIVQSGKLLEELYIRQEKKQYKADELKKLLEKIGFKVKVEKKRIKRTQLVFVEAIK
ncbi:class I SAM-dependent methyltransferase [Candidatus Woesearchaeota archaeon]|nr:class I SAM-dependent methyltransferase [Candidatus Woesearchaeota archaeon]